MFIDTFYVRSSQNESTKFQNHTIALIDFANSVEPFECKDIKTALTELMQTKKIIRDLNYQLQDAKTQLEENKKFCLFWTFCYHKQISEIGIITVVICCIFSILCFGCFCQKCCQFRQHPCCVTHNFHSYSLTKQNLSNHDNLIDTRFESI